MIYTPGPGDMLGQYAGHPHDPRTPEDDSDDTTEEAINGVRTLIACAARMYGTGDYAESEKRLVLARNRINELIGQKA